VISLFDALNKCTNLSGIRNSRPHKRWTKVNFDVDGLKLERWCVKTLITLSIGGPTAWGSAFPIINNLHLLNARFRFDSRPHLQNFVANVVAGFPS
jgi:hypothetical protein